MCMLWYWSLFIYTPYITVLDTVHKVWSIFANFVKSSSNWYMAAIIQVGESLYFIIPDGFWDSKCVLGLIIRKHQHFSQMPTIRLHFLTNLSKTTKRAEKANTSFETRHLMLNKFVYFKKKYWWRNTLKHYLE